MWRSDDGGATWRVVNWSRGLIGRAGYYIHLAVSPENEDEVFVSNSSFWQSTDGGRTWKEAKLQGPILPKAHTRFTFDWAWDGEETVIMSRSTDETGDVQPSRAELYGNWGISEGESRKAVRTTHFNAIQPWKVARDGSITDAMFS